MLPGIDRLSIPRNFVATKLQRRAACCTQQYFYDTLGELLCATKLPSVSLPLENYISLLVCFKIVTDTLRFIEFNFLSFGAHTHTHTHMHTVFVLEIKTLILGRSLNLTTHHT